MALKVKTKAAASGPKLAKAGKASKPAKTKAAAAGPSFKEGQEVIFKGYADTEVENPIFAEGERLTIVAKSKDDDGNVMYDAVRTEDYEAFQDDPEAVDGDQVHGNEIEKAPKEVADPYAIEVKSVGRLDEVLEENGGDPLEAAKAMQDAASENLFLFGGLVAQLYANRTFLTYGDEYQDEEIDGKRKHGSGWDRFTRDHFNMGGRDALRHVRIYTNMANLNLDWDQVSKNKKIGYVKLEKIAGVATQENVEELLQRAEELNVEDFKAVIRDEYVTDGSARSGSAGPKIKRTSFKFNLFEDQAESVKYVFDQGKRTTGIEDENQLLELIVMQWAQDHLSETQFAKARSEKRKVQKTLKKQGVDVAKLQESDAELDNRLAGDGEGEDEGGESEA